MDKIKIGSVVLHPHGTNRPKRMGLVCAVIGLWENYDEGYFLLATLKKNGTPSRNREKWQYLHIHQIDRCQIHTKYPKVYTCPDCQIEGYTITEAPLRYKNGEYKCVLCKERYVLDNGEMEIL